MKKKIRIPDCQACRLIYKTWFHTDFMPKLKLDANVEKNPQEIVNFLQNQIELADTYKKL